MERGQYSVCLINNIYLERMVKEFGWEDRGRGDLRTLLGVGG